MQVEKEVTAFVSELLGRYALGMPGDCPRHPKADIHWRERDVCFVPFAEIAASMPRPLCKYGIEKDIERSNLAIADNDDIQSGVVRDVAFRA
jgi:hypothetical protein